MKASSPIHSLYFSPENTRITKDGVADFYWPVSQQKLQSFSNDLQVDLSFLLRRYKNQESVIPYKIAMKFFVLVVNSVFLGDSIRQAAQADNIVVNVKSEGLVWPYTLQEKPPREADIFINSLLRPNQHRKLYDKIVGRLKSVLKNRKNINLSGNALTIDGLNLSKPNQYNWEHDVICTQRTDIIKSSTSAETNAFLVTSQKFFKEITVEDERKHCGYTVQDIEDDIFNVIKSLYQKHDVDYKPYAEQYYQDFLQRFVGLIHIHLSRLEASDTLPSHLWRGTGGHIWDLILSYAVLKRGGEVVGHDHGGGTAHLNHTQKGWIEMQGCTRFMTYTQKQANDIKACFSKWPVLSGCDIEIEYLSCKPIYRETKIRKKQARDQQSIRTVMLLSTLYTGDTGRAISLYPEIVYLDWQARMIAALKDRGYKVYFKPHPESSLVLPEAFQNVLGAEIVTVPFEEMDVIPNLFIMDITNTSLFRPVLMSNIPLLITNFNQFDWHADAEELLEKRSTIMPGYYDQDNRMQIEWNELDEGIKSSLKKCENNEFIDAYHK